MNKRKWLISAGVIISLLIIAGISIYTYLANHSAPKPSQAPTSPTQDSSQAIPPCANRAPIVTNPGDDKSVLTALYGADNLVLADTDMGSGPKQPGALADPPFQSAALRKEWVGTLQLVSSRKLVQFGGKPHWIIVFDSALYEEDDNKSDSDQVVHTLVSTGANREASALMLGQCQTKQGLAWQEESGLQALGVYGSLGYGASVRFISLGPDHPGMVLSSGETQEGYSFTSSNVFAWDHHQYKQVLSFEDSYDESGTGRCNDGANDAENKNADEPKSACQRVENDLDVSSPDTANTVWKPIVVHSDYSDDKGIKHKKNFRFTFRNGEYKSNDGELPDLTP